MKAHQYIRAALLDQDTFADWLRAHALGSASCDPRQLHKLAFYLQTSRVAEIAKAAPHELMALALVEADWSVRILALDALAARYADSAADRPEVDDDPRPIVWTDLLGRPV